MAEVMEGLSGLTNPEFELAGASFRVNKLKGLAGFELLELIRTAMAGGSMGSVVGDGSSEAETGARMMRAVMSIESKYVLQIRQIAYSAMEVKLPSVDRFVSLSSQEATINDLIEPIDNYEIIVRFIAVNFTKSTVALLNRVGLRAAAVDKTSPQ